MTTEPGPDRPEAGLASTVDLLRAALVTFAREVANRDERLAAVALAAAQAAIEARLRVPDEPEEAVGDLARERLRQAMAAVRAAIDEQARAGGLDAGG